MGKWFSLEMKAFWRKFCGVSDEFEALKDRWTALSDEFEKALPPLESSGDEKSTFQTINSLRDLLERWFDSVGFSRDREVVSEKVLTGLAEDHGKLEMASLAFFDFCTYVGLIKHAFFQRTVSLEIPQLESAVPHSPERTTGNEMFYVTADSLARVYSKCVKIPEISWDGFITFMPSIGEEGFYGAFFRPSAWLRLFHISMSEEQKYSLGTYLTLPHEFGHAAIVGSAPDGKRPRWFRLLFELAMRRTKKYLSRYGKQGICAQCVFKDVEEYGLMRRPFEDFIADLFALRIGGVNTMHSLLDLAPGLDVTVIRSNGLVRYMSDQGFQDSVINSLRSRTGDLQRELTALPPKTIESVSCVKCWKKIGEIWASSVKRFVGFRGQDPILATVSREFDHDFQSVNKVDIQKALTEGRSLTDVDPRITLSVYYDLVCKNMKPNFAATVYSIVYNRNVRTPQM